MACRDVCRTPYEAARALLDWAVDLWPYVNGKSITHGLDLRSLSAPDLLDVLHFYFEEDMHSITTAEQGEARDKSRTSLYSILYGKEYKYASSKSNGTTLPPDVANSIMEEDYEVPVPVDPFERSGKSREVKPYIAPTSPDVSSRLPFGTGLDAPLGH